MKIDDKMYDLFRQFCDAYGINNPKLDDQKMVKAFYDWLYEEKKDNDAFYLNQLDLLGVDYKKATTIEVGKGVDDSLVLPYSTMILPKDKEGLEQYGNRVIIGNLKFHGNLPFIIQKGVHVDHSIPCDNYNTFMTQNPYRPYDLNDWEKLPAGFHDLVVGVYGDVNDYDMEAKRDMLFKFMQKINPQYEPDLSEIETLDKYASIVRASSKTR